MRLYFIFLLSIILLVLPVESLFVPEYQLVRGKVRLTLDGTTYFKSFKNDKVKKKEFFDNLTQELAKAIPVDPERITNSSLIVSDLDILIKNKLTTVIGSGEYTNYLDGQYGYQIIPRWLEKNFGQLTWINTFAIYTCGNAIEKFVLSILFTSIDAEELEDDLKEGNNPVYESEKDGGTTGLIINNNDVYRQEKITKVLIEIKRELIKIFEELTVISDLMKELKNVNEKLANPNAIVELNEINKFIQVEGSTKELLDVSGHLDKLNELLIKIEEESQVKIDGNIINEINNLIESMKSMKKKLIIEQLKEDLYKAEYLINNNEKTNKTEKSELLKGINKIKKELREFNNRAESTAAVDVDEDEKKNDTVEKYSDTKNIRDGIPIAGLEVINQKRNIEKFHNGRY
ncbi:hypothetical protein C1646_763840 [Rhizophagus diaphanus]|nr:hypothetical protein C1646_763840 [Rhizophagus diaphanus] [Rhizophagus sp. MUCL 43196]